MRQAKLGLKFLKKQAQQIVAMSPQWETLSDAELNGRIQDIRDIFARRGQQVEDVRAAMAIVREVARRETGEHPYEVQVMGALGLFHGQIVEMVHR